MSVLKYTNGVGHLVMSLVMTVVGVILILGANSQAQGVGIGIIMSVQAAWFVSGSAKQIAHEVINQAQAAPLSPQPTPGPPATSVTPGGTNG